MNDFKDIKLRKLNEVDVSDTRGPTYEWCKHKRGFRNIDLSKCYTLVSSINRHNLH